MKVYWWQPTEGGFNAGDEITPVLLKDYFRVPFERSELADADIVSTGSVIDQLWKTSFGFRRRKLHVIGSGLISPKARGRLHKCIKLHSVRGYLSSWFLGESNISVGDPGLILPEAFQDLRLSECPVYRYGVIPHFMQVEKAGRWCESFSPGSFNIIDLRTNDLRSVLMKMSQCEIIISQALHGIILADALMIPNVWLDDGALSGASYLDRCFKFNDYFSSVGRPFYNSVSAHDLADPMALAKAVFRIDSQRLADLKGAISESYRGCLDSLQ